MTWKYNDQYQEFSQTEGIISGGVTPDTLVRTASLSQLWSENLVLSPSEGKPVLACIQQIIKVIEFPTPGGFTEYDPFEDSRRYPASEVRLGNENGDESLILEIRTRGIRLPDIHFIQTDEFGSSSYYERDINSAQRLNTISGGLFAYNTKIFSVRGAQFDLIYRQIEFTADLAFNDGKVVICTENVYALY